MRAQESLRHRHDHRVACAVALSAPGSETKAGSRQAATHAVYVSMPCANSGAGAAATARAAGRDACVCRFTMIFKEEAGVGACVRTTWPLVCGGSVVVVVVVVVDVACGGGVMWRGPHHGVDAWRVRGREATAVSRQMVGGSKWGGTPLARVHLDPCGAWVRNNSWHGHACGAAPQNKGGE